MKDETTIGMKMIYALLNPEVLTQFNRIVVIVVVGSESINHSLIHENCFTRNAQPREQF